MRAGPDLARLRPAPRKRPRDSRGVDARPEARLPHPAGRELVRLVLLGATAEPVRAGPAADRVDLLEPFEEAHRQTLGSARPQRPQKLHPDKRKHGRQRETGAPRRGGDEGRKRGRHDAPAAESAVRCIPIAAPLLPRPASSAAAVNESPFQASRARPPG